MSSYLTHMAIGAASGAALTALAPALIPGDPAVAAVLAPAASAIAATWPDLDHPDAWASRRVGPALALAGVAVAVLAVLPTLRPLTAVEAGALVVLGGLLGAFVGSVLLLALRVVAGGHRGGTHGLVAPALLAVMWAALQGAGGWAWLPPLLMWGWLLHIVGDVVTPGGWRPLAPFPGPTLRLPRRLARHGELLVGCGAFAVLAGALGAPAIVAPALGVVAALRLRGRQQVRRAR